MYICTSSNLGTRCLNAISPFSSIVYPGRWIIYNYISIIDHTSSLSTSILSNKGEGIVEVELAVAMKSTWDKSNGIPK